jgi:hypothetical protein
MRYLYIIIIGCLVVFMVACGRHEKHHRKLFYKNFNYITLKPIGAAYDTLSQAPYVKVDTILGNYLHLEIINGTFAKEYFYEKYDKGWLKKDTFDDSYQFDLYDGSKMISYRYRQNPYKAEDFNLVAVIQTLKDYSTDTYLLGLYNNNKSYPDFDFKIDTTTYSARLQERFFLKKDTVWQMKYEYDHKTQKTKSYTFCFLKMVPFEYFYYNPYEPFFKQIIE